MDESREPAFKRYRRDEEADPTNPNPSIVVHIRNLSPRVSEGDILEALSQFGPIAYATCMQKSRMALVEFEDIEAAKACVQHAQSKPIVVAGSQPLFNFSTSQCIERIGFESATPNKVLICTIYNVQYPIDADVMHQICSQHGRVLRIAVMHKSFGDQALVEYESAEIAKTAKHAMNGADIYSGCCTLKVEFAKPEYVKITRHDSDQRDFTVEPSGSVDPATGRKVLLPNMAGMPKNPFANRQQQSYNRYDETIDLSTAGGAGCILTVYEVNMQSFTPDMLFNIFCGYGNVLRISFLTPSSRTAMVEMGSPTEAGNVIECLQGVTLFDFVLDIRRSNTDLVTSPREPFTLFNGDPSFRDYTASRNQRFLSADAASRNRIAPPTNQLHVYNAPATMQEEKLRELLASKNAPEPQTVEIYPSKSGKSMSGMIFFHTTKEALEALALCNHLPVHGEVGKPPFVMKLALATPKNKSFTVHEPPTHTYGSVGDYRKRPYHYDHNDYSDYGYRSERGTRGSYRGRGRGDYGRAYDSYRERPYQGYDERPTVYRSYDGRV